MIRVGLIGCAKTKKACRSRAKDLYTSALFRKARRYAEANYDRWLILSAKYGLLDPKAMVDPYDETLKSFSERKIWSERVFEQLRTLFPDPKRQIFMVHAGKTYREFLMCLLRREKYQFQTPLEGLGLGKQLEWYQSREKEEAG